MSSFFLYVLALLLFTPRLVGASYCTNGLYPTTEFHAENYRTHTGYCYMESYVTFDPTGRTGYCTAPAVQQTMQIRSDNINGIAVFIYCMSISGVASSDTCAAVTDGNLAQSSTTGYIKFFSRYQITSPTSTIACYICPFGSAWTAAFGQCFLCPTGGFANYYSTSCSYCAAGSYALNTAPNPTCTACGIGKYSAASTTACLNCQLNTYASATGQTVCTQCAYGKYTITTGNYACMDCTSGTYYDDSLGYSQCSTCPSSSFPYTGFLTNCTGCPPGKFQAIISAMLVCTDCTSPYYAPLAAMPACQLCPSHSYATGTGLSVCTKCNPGTYLLDTSTTVCLACPEGTFSNTPGVACQPCPKGYYSPVLNATSCTACAINQYNSIMGKTVCSQCPANMIASTTAATDISECLPCAPGYYLDSNLVCTLCAYSTYSPAAGATACTQCPIGYTNNLQGSSNIADCFACNPGYFVDTNAPLSPCTICPAGTHAQTPLTGACTNCPRGTYSITTGATLESTCTACSIGTYSSILASNSNTCTSCPTQQFATATGMSACTYCVPGTYYLDNQCLTCMAGTYSTGSGQTSVSDCAQCSPGTYNPSAGQSTCQKCEPGTIMPYAGEVTCLYCSPGQYTDENHLACTPCPQNTYSFPAMDWPCTPCAPGLITTTTGSSQCTDSAGSNNNQQAPTCYGASIPNNYGGCDNCLSGQYVSAVGATSCSNCLLGEYVHADGTSCIKCDPGYYLPYGGFPFCFECPPGKFSTIDGATACQDCSVCDNHATTTVSCNGKSLSDLTQCRCNAGYTGNGFLCSACPTTTFQPISGAQICLACAPGSYGNTIGASTCTSCPQDTYSTVAAADSPAVCQACPSGLHSIANNPITCSRCNVGTYDNGGSCINCLAGYYSSSPGLSTCTKCEPGTYTTMIQTVHCELCSSGKYSTISGGTVCTSCAIGTYQSTQGATVCTNCSFTCPQPDQIITSLCPAGSITDTHLCTSIRQCPVGYIVAIEHTVGSNIKTGTDVLCKRSPLCPQGYFVSTPSQNNRPQVCSPCTVCPNGYQSFCTNDQDSVCYYLAQCREVNNLRLYPWLQANPTIKCLQGQYIQNISNAIPTCAPCPEYLVSPYGIWCEPCRGYRIPYTDQSICICKAPTVLQYGDQCVCPMGHGLSTLGCSICPNNTYNPSDIVLTDNWWESALNCTPCAAGFYSYQGQTTCQACPANTYRVTQPNCTSCPTGYYAPHSHLAICLLCSSTCKFAQYSTICPTDTRKFICYSCPAPPQNARWVNISTYTAQYSCVYQCNQGYYRSFDGTCMPCSILTCPTGKLLTPCSSLQDANCDLDCVNDTKPVFNSAWDLNCAWACQSGYQMQIINYKTWVQYECVPFDSVQFWNW